MLGEYSKEISAMFTKTPSGRSIELNNQYGSQYAAGGDGALIDFLRGPKNYMTGSWRYEGVNLDAVIDLGKRMHINKLSTGFLKIGMLGYLCQSGLIIMPQTMVIIL